MSDLHNDYKALVESLKMENWRLSSELHKALSTILSSGDATLLKVELDRAYAEAEAHRGEYIKALKVVEWARLSLACVYCGYDQYALRDALREYNETKG